MKDTVVEQLTSIEKQIGSLEGRIVMLEAQLRNIHQELREMRSVLYGNGKAGLVSKVQVVWLVLMYASGLVTAIAAQFASRVL